MQSYFLVNIINGKPDLPPMDSFGDDAALAISYKKGEIRTGGFWTVSQEMEGRVCVCVDTDDTTIKEMKKDSERWLHISDKKE